MTGLSLALIPYSTFLRRELCMPNKHTSNHQGFGKTLGVGNKTYFNIQGNP